MASPESRQLAGTIRGKVEDLRMLCEGIDEETATSAPSGRWSPKEILSHLCGPEGVGMLPTIQVILDQDNPRLDVEAENPFFTETRAGKPFSKLLTDLSQEYSRMADLVEGLSDEQLSRPVRVPMLTESPLGENITLGAWVKLLGDGHMGFHVDHLGEVLKELRSGSVN